MPLINDCPRLLLWVSILMFCFAGVVSAQSSNENGLDGMSLEDLMSIQVSFVSKKEQNLSDSAAAIFVITHKDLMHSGATSIPEALRMVPGIQVARIDSKNEPDVVKIFESFKGKPVLTIGETKAFVRQGV